MSFKLEGLLKKHNSLPQAKKALYVPVNTGHIHMVQAFIDNGFETYSINFAQPSGFDRGAYRLSAIRDVGVILVDACETLKPDWVHVPISKEGLIRLEDVKRAKQNCDAIFTSWAGDVRDEPLPFLVNLSKIVDFTFISNVGQLDLYRSAGCERVDYWQYGLDVSRSKPLSPNERSTLYKKLGHDISFCANHSTRFPGHIIRKDVVTKLSKKYGSKFAVYGSGWNQIAGISSKGPSPYWEQNNIYNASKVVISINNYNDLEMYFSGRQLMAMGSGVVTISHYIPGLEKYFENKKDLVWFKTADECIELVEYYLKNEEDARDIGLRGSKKAHKEHSYAARVKELSVRLGIINE